MKDVHDVAAALAQALPDALIIKSTGGPGTIIHKATRFMVIPDFVVCRGWIVGHGETAPIRIPSMTEDKVVWAAVDALVKHRNRLADVAQETLRGPVRTLIILRGHEDPDSINVGMWVY